MRGAGPGAVPLGGGSCGAGQGRPAPAACSKLSAPAPELSDLPFARLHPGPTAEAALAYNCPACGHTLSRHDTFSPEALARATPLLQQGDHQQQAERQAQQAQQAQQQGGAAPADAAQQQGRQQGAAGGAAGPGGGGGGGGGQWESSAKLDALMAVLKKLRDKANAGAPWAATLLLCGRGGGGSGPASRGAAAAATAAASNGCRAASLCTPRHCPTPPNRSRPLPGPAVEAEARQQRSVLTSGRSLSHARLAAALGGGGGGARGPTRGAGAPGSKAGAAGASRGASPKAAAMEKVIVFSQWTAMLDLAEAPLRREGCAPLCLRCAPPAMPGRVRCAALWRAARAPRAHTALLARSPLTAISAHAPPAATRSGGWTARWPSRRGRPPSTTSAAAPRSACCWSA